eukprot:TRINITY_DN10611_c0_g1_i3.p1 TRINITY_DN10611_c0_g1~~TRINITY_DN10611_c0_g1_i3.p1  ORF type:complete len:644 (+),score=59.69 TRINITY_DN10611_c0_g1_i3:111-2042(+)
MMENFVPRIKMLLGERNHGVLLTGITLMIELVQLDADVVSTFRKLVPSLVRVLKNLMSGYAPEHDVQGIADPFLQVKILHLLSLLGQGNTEASEAMNDILAQIATNTDGSRNVGNAILYQCVLTIMSIESESGLRVLAINILGRFLLNRDNNIRYVALNTLTKVVTRDFQSVARHTNTIVACLSDSDASIRKRALELIYGLVTKETVRPLVREMLAFLPEADHEIRPDVITKICTVTEKYAPTKRWHVDIIIRVMSMSGHQVPDQVAANMIALIASSSDLQAYAVGRLYLALVADNGVNQHTLAQTAVWCIGEFGDLLVSSPIETRDSSPLQVTEKDVVDALQNLLRYPPTLTITKDYALTALLKLSTRFGSSGDRIRDLIDGYSRNLDVELQQRSCEYENIFNFQNSESLRQMLLDRMPAPEDIAAHYGADETPPASPAVNRPASPVKSGGQHGGASLIEQLFGSDEPSVSTPATPPPGFGSHLGSVSGGQSLLEEILAPSSPSHSTPVVSPVELLNPAQPAQPTFPTVTVFQKNGLTITFRFDKPAPSSTVIHVTATNATPTAMSRFSFLTAVPRYLALTVGSPSGTVVAPNNTGKITQDVRVENSLQGQKPLVLKIRVQYNIGGSDVTDESTVTNFPPGL